MLRSKKGRVHHLRVDVHPNNAHSYCECCESPDEDEDTPAHVSVDVGPVWSSNVVDLCWDCTIKIQERLAQLLRENGRIE